MSVVAYPMAREKDSESPIIYGLVIKSIVKFKSAVPVTLGSYEAVKAFVMTAYF